MAAPSRADAAQPTNVAGSGTAGTSHTRARRLRLLGIAFIAADIIVAATALAVFAGRTTTPTATPPRHTASTEPTAARTDPGVTAAVTWSARNLRPGAVIAGDAQTVAALSAAGFTHAATVPATATPQYLISTQRVRTTGRNTPAVARLIADSVPIADFGSLAASVEVRELSTITPSALARRRADDRRARASAERELLTNPAVHAGSAATGVLRSGELDMRAATVLAVLAQQGRLDISAIPVDPAERAAGTPARVIELRTAAPAAARQLLARLPRSWRPASDRILPGGSHRLTWPIDPEPPLTLDVQPGTTRRVYR